MEMIKVFVCYFLLICIFLLKGGVKVFNLWTISPVGIGIGKKMLKKKLTLKLSKNFIQFFQGLKFYCIWVSPTTKFYLILASPSTKFYSIRCPRQPNFNPFGVPDNQINSILVSPTSALVAQAWLG